MSDRVSPASPQPAAQPPASAPVRRSWRTIGKVAIAAIAVAAILLLGQRAAPTVARFSQSLAELGPWGAAAFVVLYAVASVFLVPGSLLTLAAGALFGLLQGTLYAWTGATLGACASFLLARYGARRLVERRFLARPAFAAIDRAVAADGRRIAFLLRLSPVFPFVVLNYTLGLTRIRFVDYLLACLGMLPGTLLYVYYGKLGGDVAALATGVRRQGSRAEIVVLVLGLAATVAVTAVVTRLARRALKEAADV